MEGMAHGWLYAEACDGQGKPAPDSLYDVLFLQKFFKEIEGDAACPAFLKAFCPGLALFKRPLRRGKADEEPAYRRRHPRPCIVFKGLVEAFPVPGMQPAPACVLSGDIGEVGDNGPCLSRGRRKGCRCKAPVYFGKPVYQAHCSLHRMRHEVIAGAQERFFPGACRIFACKCPAVRPAELSQRPGAVRLKPAGFDRSGIVFSQDFFQAAQAVYLVQCRSDLGMAFIDGGYPPHGKI